MTDLVITAANVVADTSAQRTLGTAGETITAGKATAAEGKKVGGIALNGAALNQPVSVLTSGPVTIGATLTAGTAYYLSETAGGIQPATDLASGENVCLIGLAASTTVLNVGIQAPGVTL